MTLFIALVVCLVSAGSAIDAFTDPTDHFSWPDYSPCEDGYEPLPGQFACIKIHNRPRLTWSKASQKCNDEFARLAEIVDQGFSDALFKYIREKKSKRGRRYWTGVHKVDGEWATFGSPVSDFQPWVSMKSREDRMLKDCVEVITNKRMAWRNNKCSRKRSFVCMAPMRMAK